MTNTMVFPTIDLQRTGQRIERLRRERGFSVRDLQAYFGFEYPQAIYKWQWGECLPSVDNLFALARLFGVQMQDLLVGDDQEVSNFFQGHDCPHVLALAEELPCLGQGEGADENGVYLAVADSAPHIHHIGLRVQGAAELCHGVDALAPFHTVQADVCPTGPRQTGIFLLTVGANGSAQPLQHGELPPTGGIGTALLQVISLLTMDLYLFVFSLFV